ncbi:MAG TPA: hypothetical protein VFZ34_20495 [Blastocatellia bacterium]|nr:hypothetical protein [Blastocatellia bacterium]
MPTLNELFSQLEPFGSNLTKDKKDALKLAVDKIKKRLDEFKEAVDKLDDDLNLDDEKKRADAQERVRQFTSSEVQKFLGGTSASTSDTALTQTAADQPKAAKEQTQMQEFFAGVANSLIDAQQQLNLRSIQYLKELALLEVNIPPAYFAIPSVKADLKVGFSQSNQKGVNLILFSNKSQREEYGESTLSFELVAAPPPPGAIPAGGFLTPIPSVLVLGEKKKQVLQAIRDAAKAQPGAPIAHVNNKIYTNTESLAVVLRHLEVPDKEDADNDGQAAPRYLVIWPAQKENATRDFWTEMMIFALLEKDGKLTLDGAIFESKATNMLRIGTNADLKTQDAAALQALVLNLGDSLMAVVLAIAEWLDSITDPRTKPNG